MNERPRTENPVHASLQPATGTSDYAQEKQALMAQYLGSLDEIAGGTATLRQAVLRLVQMGVRRSELVRRAVAGGHAEKKVRKLLSEVLCGVGLRRRKPGGGRKSDPLAISTFDDLTARYGFRRARRLVLAMRRVADARAAQLRSQQPGQEAERRRVADQPQRISQAA